MTEEPAEEGAGGDEPAWLDLALEEYRALRTEVIEMQKAQQWIVGLGLTAVGIVASQVPNLLKNSLAATSVFLVVVPLVVAAVILVWLAQIGGMMRVGYHLYRLESHVHATWEIPPEVLGWETFLRQPGIRGSWIRLYERGYYGIIGLFSIIAAGSVALGWYRGTHLRRGETIGPLSGSVAGVGRLTLVTMGVGALLFLTALFAVVELALARNRAPKTASGG